MMKRIEEDGRALNLEPIINRKKKTVVPGGRIPHPWLWWVNLFA